MPEIVITCDGCGGRAAFKDLVALQKAGGFCSDVCSSKFSRRRFTKQHEAGTWSHVDEALIAQRGRREDLSGVNFRSATEANVARYFRLLGVSWEYEPRRFVFHGTESAPVNYTPDFFVTEEWKTYWVEVKGRWKPHDRQKLRKFQKHYPEEFSRLWVISRWGSGTRGIEEKRLLLGISPTIRLTDYKTIQSLRGMIPGWEGR